MTAPNTRLGRWIDNRLHCIRHTLSPRTFTEKKWLNGLYTRWSSSVFVARHWRRGAFALLIATLAWSLGSILYRLVVDPSATDPMWSRAFSWSFLASSAVAVVTFYYRFSQFHRNRIFGTEHQFPRKLSDDFVKSRDPAVRKPGRLNFADLTSGDRNTKLYQIGTPSDVASENTIAFEHRVSRQLLETDIFAEKAAGGGYFHCSAEDVMEASRRHRAVQVEAFNIRRANALDAGKSFFDAPKVSLRALDVTGNGLTARLGKTSYYCSMVTNDLAAQMILRESGTLVSDEGLGLFPALEQGEGFRLRPLEECGWLSNQIGMAVLAVSADFVPIFCFQSSRANINEGRSVLSGSGSLDFADFANAGARETGNLSDVIRFGMARELLEETGAIPQDSYRRQDHARLRAYSRKIQLAGMYRDLRRGGQPIFFGFCRMSASREEIMSRAAEKVCISDAPVETRLDKQLANEPVKTAKGMVTYIEHYIRTTPDAIRLASDQVRSFQRLLEVKVVQQHFNRAMRLEDPAQTANRR